MKAPQDKKRQFLSQKDDFTLMTWLVANPPKAGESWVDVTARATEALGFPGMNKDHVANRCRTLELPLIPAIIPNDTDLSVRVEELERNLARVARIMVGLVQHEGLSILDSDFIKSLDK